MRTLFFFLILISTLGLSAQYEFDFEDKVYTDDIKSVTFGIEGTSLSYPIVYLQSSVALRLEFDDLGLNEDGYIYDIIHCDRNWQPSDLDNIQYIDGFTEEEIEEYDNSHGTIVDYVHYGLTLPNEDIRWTFSGNYVLVVYEDTEERNVVLTRRFMVVDKKVKVNYEFQNGIGATYNTHQEIDFVVNFENQKMQDPLGNISAVILQNNRWDNAVMDIRARFVDNEDLIFDYSGVVTFPGYKEFRSFDTRTLYSTGYNINSIELNEVSNDVLLELSGKRVDNNYRSINDANGQYVCYTEDHPESLLAADYTNVVFSLKSHELDKDVFVVGRFNDYRPDASSQLHYDEAYGSYFGQMLLKQGYYDYMFATNSKEGMRIEEVEGASFETENDYTILVYYHSRYLGYDQLIGYTSFNSLNK